MESRRILVLGSSEGGGDWPPLVAAALALTRRGHRVTYFGDARLAEATRESGLEIESVPLGRDLASYMQAWRRDQSQIPPIAQWVEDVLPIARSSAQACAPAVLLCQAITAPLALLLREEIRVPACQVFSTFYVGAAARRRIEDDFSAAAVPVGNGMAALASAMDLVLLATDPLFDPAPEPPPPRHHWVGPLMFEETQAAPDYLGTAGDPWALITLSSVRQDDEGRLARAAVLALSAFPLRALLTLGDEMAPEDLGQVPTNARVESYVPHTPVLERAAICVSHAGHGIVSKALYFGVPMVLVPWDRDQPGVAARAEALGVARVVRRERLSEAALAAAIREVLVDPAFRERAASHSRRMKSLDTDAQVCSHIEALAAVAG